MFRYPVGGEVKYASEAQELIRPERNTLLVSFEDVERYNQQLATTVLEEYYRCVMLLLVLCEYLKFQIKSKLSNSYFSIYFNSKLPQF